MPKKKQVYKKLAKYKKFIIETQGEYSCSFTKDEDSCDIDLPYVLKLKGFRFGQEIFRGKTEFEIFKYVYEWIQDKIIIEEIIKKDEL